MCGTRCTMYILYTIHSLNEKPCLINKVTFDYTMIAQFIAFVIILIMPRSIHAIDRLICIILLLYKGLRKSGCAKLIFNHLHAKFFWKYERHAWVLYHCMTMTLTGKIGTYIINIVNIMAADETMDQIVRNHNQNVVRMVYFDLSIRMVIWMYIYTTNKRFRASVNRCPPPFLHTYENSKHSCFIYYFHRMTLTWCTWYGI